MAKTTQDIINFIQENGIQMVDFKIVDINGQFRHVTIPASQFTEDTMKDGIGFDASNYGYAVVEKSDMVFIPDLDTAMIDPYCNIPTLSITGNAMVIDHPNNRPLDQYPRNIVLAAEQYMKDSGLSAGILETLSSHQLLTPDHCGQAGYFPKVIITSLDVYYIQQGTI